VSVRIITTTTEARAQNRVTDPRGPSIVNNKRRSTVRRAEREKTCHTDKIEATQGLSRLIQTDARRAV